MSTLQHVYELPDKPVPLPFGCPSLWFSLSGARLATAHFVCAISYSIISHSCPCTSSCDCSARGRRCAQQQWWQSVSSLTSSPTRAALGECRDGSGSGDGSGSRSSGDGGSSEVGPRGLFVPHICVCVRSTTRALRHCCHDSRSGESCCVGACVSVVGCTATGTV